MKLFLTCALLLPMIMSSSIAANAQSNELPAQVTIDTPKDLSEQLQKVDEPEKTAIPEMKLIEKSKLYFALEDCRRDGQNVTCNLQFTNIDNKEQSINLFADCSRIIHGSKEFGGFNAQIDHSSSATLSVGVAKKGFITFQNVAVDISNSTALEIAYDTIDGGGTVRFSNVDIQ
jgi:hypothetical protein